MKRSTLQTEIKKRNPFDSPEVEAHLNIIRTYGMLMGRLVRLFKRHGLSPAQYNILRILRGVGGDGLPCLELSEQMVTRVPDVTRLVDRLEEAGLVARVRCTKDRRVVWVKITDQGLALLAKLDQPVLEANKKNLGHMSHRELAQISRLMTKARQFAEPGEAD